MKKAMVVLKEKAAGFINCFKKDERGVSPVVATLLVLLIVVVMAAAFQTKINEYFNDLWKQVAGIEFEDEFTLSDE